MTRASEDVRESMKLLALGSWRPNEIVVGDINHFCERLEIKKAVLQANALSEFYGVRVRESDVMPKDRAVLIDETGKVVRIFEV
jgi:hypothetical protein